jgi:hypothetical protein
LGFARALLISLDEWVTEGRDPPPSVYPMRQRGELVERSGYFFPKLAEVPFPAPFAEKYLLDFNEEPPARLAPYPVLLPKSDADGNMVGGVRHPFMVAPLATNVGWNPRAKGFGAGGGCYASGMSIPFPITKADRAARSDPRLSLEERYKNEDDFIKRVSAAADRLVARRLLLRDDAEAVKAEASSRYRAALSHSAPR